MSTISHQHKPVAVGRRYWYLQFLVLEALKSFAIVAMWIAVAITAVWGPDFVSGTPGSTTTTIPSGVAVALFASVGTWAVAKYGFGRRDGQR